ncbi:MAG: hypothetical protein CM1200mP2_24200 [Planctomycetaceae bacterium]|nr:MAG: hypothetical protein CM1200mP2_24200 [Planctomycetaceae bacterium]
MKGRSEEMDVGEVEQDVRGGGVLGGRQQQVLAFDDRGVIEVFQRRAEGDDGDVVFDCDLNGVSSVIGQQSFTGGGRPSS